MFRLRCGYKPKAAHIRWIVVWEKPVSKAIEGIDQSRVEWCRTQQCPLDYLSNLIVIDGSRAARAGFATITVGWTIGKTYSGLVRVSRPKELPGP